MPMTKDELRASIENGILPPEYEPQDIGQGYGFKSEFKDNDDIVIYIPEHSYHDGMPEDLYTMKDFVEICNGDREKALDLFESVDWQYPETLYSEWESYNE